MGSKNPKRNAFRIVRMSRASQNRYHSSDHRLPSLRNPAWSGHCRPSSARLAGLPQRSRRRRGGARRRGRSGEMRDRSFDRVSQVVSCDCSVVVVDCFWS
ncbi:hypothetical protein M758_1G181000 [Ceratodon purpureus]|nr:hypothetical protein M758_1G181000 [Ceratodon purpureus]